MKRGLALVVVTIVITGLLSGKAFADSVKRQPPPRAKSGASMRSRLVGMALGAGAGFGLGMVTALHKLPDASCKDGKVLVSAGSFGTIGAMFGYWAGAGPAAPHSALRRTRNGIRRSRGLPTPTWRRASAVRGSRRESGLKLARVLVQQLPGARDMLFGGAEVPNREAQDGTGPPAVCARCRSRPWR